MGKVNPKVKRAYVSKYRAKPGVRRAEKEYGKIYGRLLYATAKGRAYHLFKGARLRAKQQNWDFDLDVDFILHLIEKGFCPVLGLPFDLVRGDHKHHNPLAPSLDRKNSNKGYTKDNVQVVSVWWNTAKGAWSDDFNKMALRRAVDHFEFRRFPWEQ